MKLKEFVPELRYLYRNYKDWKSCYEWYKQGYPVPPPQVVKISTIRQYANALKPSVFIETGTLKGDTLAAVREAFDHSYSIELSDYYYKFATERFRGDARVSLVQGDSGQELGRILSTLTTSCLFWLDGHYSEGNTARGSKDTPVLEELGHIFKHTCREHVVLIDDARCFTGTNDYPSLDALRKLIAVHRPEWEFKVSHDVIRIHRKVDLPTWENPVQ